MAYVRSSEFSSVRSNRIHHGLTAFNDAALGRRSRNLRNFGDKDSVSGMAGQACYLCGVCFLVQSPKSSIESCPPVRVRYKMCFGPFLHDPYRKPNCLQAYHGGCPWSEVQGRSTSAQNSPTELPQSSLVSPWADQSTTMR